MKLVITVEHYAPHIGGAERVVQRVGEGLAARGHRVVVITSGRRSSELMRDVRVERFAVRGNAARGIRGPADAALSLIEEWRPDVLLNYAAQTWTTDVCTSFLSQQHQFVHVLAPCGFSGLGSRTYHPYFARMQEWLPQYDALIFHSAIYQDWAFAQAAGAIRVHVIPNGADDPVPTRRGHDGHARVVTVGGHVKSKGHHDFIRAVRTIAEGRAVEGIVVAPRRNGFAFARGCQPRCFLESLRSASPIRFVDGARPDVAANALATADVFLFPSQIECAPLVVLEAMAAGVPWVSYDVGNVRELEGGIIASDYHELIAAAAALLDAPERRSQLGAAGRTAWQNNHQWTPIISRYENLFNGLCAEAAADVPIGTT